MVSSLIGVRWVMAPVGWWMPSNLLCDALFHHCARLLLCFAFSTTDIRQQCGSVVQPEALFIISPSHNLFWWKPQSLSEICHQTSSSEELKNLCLCTLDCQKKTSDLCLALCLCSLWSGHAFWDLIFSWEDDAFWYAEQGLPSFTRSWWWNTSGLYVQN